MLSLIRTAADPARALRALADGAPTSAAAADAADAVAELAAGPAWLRRLVGRREAVRTGALAALAAGALPVALATVARPAMAQPATVLAVLNFALTLEYLEAEFYNIATGDTAIPPSYGTGVTLFTAPDAPPRQVFVEIAKHETAHVAFLRAAIAASGGTPVAKPTFDFSAGGAFADVYTNPATFLALAQAFEDTGVRAYKGGAAALVSNLGVLDAALQIHSIEARHASKVRRLRGDKGWIVGAGTANVPAAAQPVYGAGSPAAGFPAESNTTQAGVNVATLTGVGAAAAAESFDEPLDVATVNAIAALFIA